MEPETTHGNASDELTDEQQEEVTGGVGGAGSVVGINFSSHGYGGNGGNGGAGGTSPIGTSGL